MNSSIIFHLFFILGISIVFTACKGQESSPTTTAPQKAMELGSIVTELNATIWDIYQDQQSNFWFGSKDHGVYFYNGNTLRRFSKEDGLISNEVRDIQEDASGNIFIETTAGVSKFDGRTFTTLEIKRDNPSNWVLNPNDLWFRIGFNTNGPYRYDGEYLHYLEFPKAPYEATLHSHILLASFSPYGIYSIYKDKEGSIWFGTSGIGLCRFDGKNISWHYEEQLQKTTGGGDFGMRAIIQDKDGYFWFNNARHRYEILPNESNQLNYKKQDGLGFIENQTEQYPYFLSIAEDNTGNLWMVTYDEGVWKNNGKELLNYPVKDGSREVLLFSIFKDNQGVLWLGTHNAGAYKFNGTTFEKFQL